MLKTKLINQQKQIIHQAFIKHQQLEIEWQNLSKYFTVMFITILLGLMIKSNLHNIDLGLLIYTIGNMMMLSYHHFKTTYYQYKYKHLK